jgi:acyl-CoA synthetase (NDP forming)
MLTSGRLLADVCAQHGAIVVESMRELTDACRLLAGSRWRLPSNPRAGMVAISGGMLALMSDACEQRVGLSLFEETTVARLRDILPAYSAPINPVDVTGGVLERQGMLTGAVETVLADRDVDVLLLGLDNRGYDRVRELGPVLSRRPDELRKPVVEVLWQAPAIRDWEMERALAAHDIVVVDEPADVGRRLSWMTRRTPPPTDEPGVYRGPRLSSPAQLLDWEVQCAVLTALGLDAPRGIVVQDAAELGDGHLQALGTPVVVKPVPNAVQHKSDRGLVVTGLATLPAVRAALATVRAAVPDGVGLLVQAQVSGWELLVAARQDADWGPILSIGAGGVLTELLVDTTSLSIPCSAAEIRARIDMLRIGPALRGYRGRPPADLEALVTGALHLAALLLAHAGVIHEVELNPVIVGPQGRAYAVDLLAQ